MFLCFKSFVLKEMQAILTEECELSQVCEVTLFEFDGLVPLPCVCFCGSFMVLFFIFLIYIVISHSCEVKFESMMCVKPAQSVGRLEGDRWAVHLKGFPSP